MKVTLLAPNVGIPGTFYEIFGDFLRVAARQLRIDFEVVDGTKQRETMLARGRAIATSARRPDYVLLVNYMGVGQELLPVNAAAGVGTFFVVEALGAAELGMVGGGGKGYLGQILPDDVEAGKLLAQILTDAARTRGLVDGSGKVQVGALAGEHTQAGNARFRGWQALTKEKADVVQAGFQYGRWEEDIAKAVTAQMLGASPQISVLWCANDAMALGAQAAAIEAGRRPGEDILIGGVDLMDRALAAVAAGSLEVSIGGHLVDGVRALLLLHDHHEKRDLVAQHQATHLVAVRAAQAGRYLKFMQERAWHHVDFTRFSRVLNPHATGEVSLDAIMNG
jgi:hypothetical protein